MMNSRAIPLRYLSLSRALPDRLLARHAPGSSRSSQPRRLWESKEWELVDASAATERGASKRNHSYMHRLWAPPIGRPSRDGENDDDVPRRR